MIQKEIAWALGGVLALVAVGAVAFTSAFSRTSEPPAPSSIGSAVNGAREASADCAKAADPCDCSERRAIELLSGCFADKAFEAVKSAGPSCKNPGLLGVQAQALAATGQGDTARATADSLLKTDPKNRFARRALAIVRLNDRDFDGADALLGELLAEDAKDADSLFYSALVQRGRDRYREARQGFLRVLRLNRRHIDARFNLVTLTASIGAKDEAQHHLDELQRIAPVGDPRLSVAKTALSQARAARANEAKNPPAVVIQNERSRLGAVR